MTKPQIQTVNPTASSFRAAPRTQQAAPSHSRASFIRDLKKVAAKLPKP